MKTKFAILFSALFLFTGTIYCQEKKLWGGVEMSGGLTFKDTGKQYDYSASGAHSLLSINGVVGYYINPNFSVGISLGSNNYRRINLSAIPLSLDLRYHPIADHNLVVIGDVGYSVFTNESNLKTKFISDIAIGYKLLYNNTIKFTPSIGYDFCTYYIDHTDAVNQVNVKSNMYKHSLFIKFSFTY